MKILPFRILLLIIILIPAFCFSQQKSWTLSGYLSDMQSSMFEDFDESWINDNQLHNRLNFKWYKKNLSFAAEFRNRLLWGDSFLAFENYPDLIDTDQGWIDMSENLVEKQSFILNSSIDRLYFDYTIKKFQITAGRQRINWGNNFAWNPNDIFNAYSYFEVDYEERPGSDAVLLQYYPGYTSSFQLAVKINSENKATAAAMYRFNKWEYDFQILGGVLNEEEFVTGGAWSGNIWDIGFRGEFSYFYPNNGDSDTSKAFLGGLSFDYTTSESLSLTAEILYNSYAKNLNLDNFLTLYTMPLSVKTISFSEYSYFFSANWQISPLLSSSLSTMLFAPKMKGFYFGPTLTYSIAQNFDFSFIMQWFNLNPDGEGSQKFAMTYLKTRWNF